VINLSLEYRQSILSNQFIPFLTRHVSLCNKREDPSSKISKSFCCEAEKAALTGTRPHLSFLVICGRVCGRLIGLSGLVRLLSFVHLFLAVHLFLLHLFLLATIRNGVIFSCLVFLAGICTIRGRRIVRTIRAIFRSGVICYMARVICRSGGLVSVCGRGSVVPRPSTL
jgi:hypothetical protein